MIAGHHFHEHKQLDTCGLFRIRCPGELQTLSDTLLFGYVCPVGQRCRVYVLDFQAKRLNAFTNVQPIVAADAGIPSGCRSYAVGPERLHLWLADMNARVRIFGMVGGLALSVVILILFQARPRSTPLINGARLANAVAQYTKDLHSRGEALPRTITLDALVGRGYLGAEDTKPLQGVELVFHTDAVDTNPQMLLVEARMADGQVQAVLADGSVQQFSPTRWAEIQRNVGQPQQGVDPTQPLRSP